MFIVGMVGKVLFYCNVVIVLFVWFVVVLCVYV